MNPIKVIIMKTLEIPFFHNRNAMPQNWKELTNAKALKQMLFMVTKRNWKFKLFSFILKAFSVCQSPDIIVVLTFVDYKNKLWHDTFMRRQNFLVKRQRKCQCLYKIRTQKLCSFICKHEISTFSILYTIWSNWKHLSGLHTLPFLS